MKKSPELALIILLKELEEMDRKIVVLDINTANFFNTTKDLEVWKNFFNFIQANNHQLVFMSSCWQQAVLYLLDLLSLDDVDIIAESGAIIWISKTNEFIYQSFLDSVSIDTIVHHAIITNSGVFAIGKSKISEEPNTTINYFISLEKYKQFKLIWLTEFDQTLKYQNFLKNLSEMDVSSIYVFSPQYHLDFQLMEHISSGQPKFHYSNFYNENFLFTSTKNSKFSALKTYVKSKNCSLKDVHYLNVTEVPINNINQLASVVFLSKKQPDNDEEFNNPEISIVLKGICEQLMK
ncbi:hypothetical protein CM9_02250 [Mycoplasmoides genitalium M2321]|nr:hypothetical protein CM9_02250 [Mycoplasmoides genitalium M2321]